MVNTLATYPRSPPRGNVLKFEEEDLNGPDSNHILLNWSEPLSKASKWNRAALTLLATEFKTAHPGHAEHLIAIENLIKAMGNTLQTTRVSVIALEGVAAGDDDAMKATSNRLAVHGQGVDQRQRRLSRRTKVIPPLH